MRALLFLAEEGRATHANPEVGWRVEGGDAEEEEEKEEKAGQDINLTTPHTKGGEKLETNTALKKCRFFTTFLTSASTFSASGKIFEKAGHPNRYTRSAGA